MGKSLAFATSRLLDLAKVVSQASPKLAKRRQHPVSNPGRIRVDPREQLKLKMEKNSFDSDGLTQRGRMPLSAVVSDCARRWFDDALKEAKAGDIGMMVLVGQMYHSGYGVIQNTDKGQAWINKASKCRSSALKVGHKPPGYNASDSESDALNGGQFVCEMIFSPLEALLDDSADEFC
ncbi:hypothetical protein V2J09_014119 [Rumex salicifolius]